MAGVGVFGLCIFLSVFYVSVVHAYIEGLYCGKDNCYDVLGVTRESARVKNYPIWGKSERTSGEYSNLAFHINLEEKGYVKCMMFNPRYNEIVRAYRNLARKWHPDRFKKEEDKEEATVMFRKIANAYEILKDEEQRNDYDYMLDHPDEYYAHYFYYYRRRMAPKIDVRIVIAVTITVISFIQYWSAWNNYTTAIAYLAKEPKYRIRATEIARSEGLMNLNKKKSKKSKEEMREEWEAIIRQVIEEKMDIRGGYKKPKCIDILWIQLLLSPYYLLLNIWWWIRWIWKFNICRHSYGKEEKCYIIRKKMSYSNSQWEAIYDQEKENYLKQELWIKENFQVWKNKQDEELKAKLAESARYKSYRRYMKKGGPGQIMFGPE